MEKWFYCTVFGVNQARIILSTKNERKTTPLSQKIPRGVIFVTHAHTNKNHQQRPKREDKGMMMIGLWNPDDDDAHTVQKDRVIVVYARVRPAFIRLSVIKQASIGHIVGLPSDCRI